MRRLLGLLLLLVLPATASATGFTDYGYDILASTRTRTRLEGALRLRSAALYNLDLDRGTTPSGELLFPVSLSDPSAQTLYAADMRLRTDLAFYAPGGVVAVKARIDVLDNLPIGGSADGIPGGTLTQRPPGSAFAIKRAWGEVITPVGYLAAGRMGHHWGLGLLGNGGDCIDCDSGDSADRVAFVTAALGHLFAVAYDFSASGYLVPLKDEVRVAEVEPTAAVRSFAVALLRWRDERGRRRRRLADKTTLEYGAYYARRWQAHDLPASWLPLARPTQIDSAQVVERGLSAHAADLWLRITHPSFRVELEGAVVSASVEQASALPGFLLPERIESLQYGGVLESDFGAPEARLGAGVHAGFASGDPAPGFGARPPLQTLSAPQAGDLDGPQALSPGDRRVDNFRFHPDYRVDRILFRELIGTVTDAFYVRPHARLRLLDLGGARLEARLAAIASWAHFASSTPGGQRPLGIEIDPTLAYHSDDGFYAALEYAVLFPQEGMDNTSDGLDARTAHLVRAHLAYGF